jgi:organic hydroperoxide reductase OsmC/OhrA
MRAVSVHANGTQVVTDLPQELGGEGEHITPGWLFRAGFASCAATSIAMHAATHGIELTALEAKASSRSDTRGLLGMAESDGTPVYSGPLDMQLSVRICANGVSAERLHSLVEEALRCSPIPNAVQNAVPVQLSIQIDAGQE